MDLALNLECWQTMVPAEIPRWLKLSNSAGLVFLASP
jgi:hypothetical protein